jgi:preprotein translocase subunit YajC
MIVASTVWDVLSALLPFVLLFAFWIFLMNRVRGRPNPGQDAVIEKLDEIRDEIRRLREAVEQRPLGR